MANTKEGAGQDRAQSKYFTVLQQLEVEGICCCQQRILPPSSCTRFTYSDHLLFQMKRDSGYSTMAEQQKQVKAQGHLLKNALCRCCGRLDVLNHLLRDVTDTSTL